MDNTAITKHITGEVTRAQLGNRPAVQHSQCFVIYLTTHNSFEGKTWQCMWWGEKASEPQCY